MAIRTIKIWLNAFIPDNIPGLTRRVPGAGVHRNKTMIPGPTVVSDCFLTDQRGFSSNPAASSRMHSEISIDVTVPAAPREINQIHRCDETIEVDCEDGDQECNGRAAINRMKFNNLRFVGGKILVDVVGAANNPCFTGSPDIDYKGTVEITVIPQRLIAQVAFNGLIEPFPAFEMYAAVNGGIGVPIFRVNPLPGATPGNLFGNANRPVSGTVELGPNA